MKLFKTILLFLSAITIMAGCDSNCPDPKEDTDFDLNSDYLEQTVWEGTFVIYDT